MSSRGNLIKATATPSHEGATTLVSSNKQLGGGDKDALKGMPLSFSDLLLLSSINAPSLPTTTTCKLAAQYKFNITGNSIHDKNNNNNDSDEAADQNATKNLPVPKRDHNCQKLREKPSLHPKGRIHQRKTRHAPTSSSFFSSSASVDSCVSTETVPDNNNNNNIEKDNYGNSNKTNNSASHSHSSSSSKKKSSSSSSSLKSADPKEKSSSSSKSRSHTHNTTSQSLTEDKAPQLEEQNGAVKERKHGSESSQSSTSENKDDKDDNDDETYNNQLHRAQPPAPRRRRAPGRSRSGEDLDFFSSHSSHHHNHPDLRRGVARCQSSPDVWDGEPPCQPPNHRSHFEEKLALSKSLHGSSEHHRHRSGALHRSSVVERPEYSTCRDSSSTTTTTKAASPMEQQSWRQ